MSRRNRTIMYILGLLFIVICVGLTIFICIKFSYPNYFATYGVFGDWIGGVIGTFISFVTLVIICFQLNQVTKQLAQNEKQLSLQNEQALQNTVALLLQSYQHTVEDYDFKVGNNNALQGREAIKESLALFKKGTDVNYISETFPTHIPAIIVSILYTIKDSNFEEDKKNNLYRQIKTMLSFEERQLLLLYLLELIESEDGKDTEDYIKDKNLLAKAIFTNGSKSKALKGFEKIYEKIYNHGK